MRRYTTIHDLFYSYLDEMYAAENQIIHIVASLLPQLSQPAYQDALMLYRMESIRHRNLLHEVFEALAIHPDDHPCTTVVGSIKELKLTIQHYPASLIRDLALLSVLQRLCHYALAHYQSLSLWAERAKHPAIAVIFTTIQQQKTYAAHILNRLVEQGLERTIPAELMSNELGGIGQMPNLRDSMRPKL